MVYSPLRIKRPAIRRGWLENRRGGDRSSRGKEEFVEVSWDTVLDLVADELTRVRQGHGAQGIFGGSYGWSSAGRFHHARTLIRRFLFAGGGCVDQAGNYSWGSAQFLLPHVIGTYTPLTGKVTHWPSLIKHTQLILAFGGLAIKNGQVSSGGAAEHSLERWLREAAAAGIDVVNISPVKFDTPSFLNATWHPIRPNTDVALMLALVYCLIRDKQCDRAFLTEYCVGFDQLERYVLGVEDGLPKSPGWASVITGLSEVDITGLAHKLVGKRVYITCSFAVQRAHHGEQPYWMAIALAAVLGQIGLPGGGFGFGHGSMNGVGNPRPSTPGPAMSAGNNPADCAIPVARLSDMLLKPGERYAFNGKEYVYPDIRLIYWAGGNPFHHHQDLNRLLEAWQKPETIIVNEIWWTATARHADIVLPATTALERNDIGGSSRDRYILAMHQAISPLYQARDDFQIFSELSKRLGYQQRFTDGLSEKGWIRKIYADCVHQHDAAGIALPDFKEFWDKGYVRLPQPEHDFVLFSDFRQDPAKFPLRTPSGKIELSSDTIAAFHYDDCPGHPAWIPPREWLGCTHAGEHPLHLVSAQPADRLHSQMDPGTLSKANKIRGHEKITINTHDASQRGIRTGDVVKVFNGRGACLAGAFVSDEIVPGVVLVATGAWFDPDSDTDTSLERHGNPNVLTLDIGTSQLSQGPNAMSALVEVARYLGPEMSVKAWDTPMIRSVTSSGNSAPIAGRKGPPRMLKQ